MFAIIHLLATFIADLFKSRRRLEVENLFLRHQLNVALRRAPQRVRLRARDRALMVWLTRMWPSLLGLTRVVQPATILRWHRCGFRAYWRWKSRARPGRPRVERELRDLIRRMSEENPLWGAPRIHGELLKLGFKDCRLLQQYRHGSRTADFCNNIGTQRPRRQSQHMPCHRAAVSSHFDPQWKSQGTSSSSTCEGTARPAADGRYA
jgi:hypothetical protein